VAELGNYEEIGNRIRNVRAHFSQEEFARRLGISLSAYRNYEYGERTPPGDVLVKLSSLFDVPADWILKGKQEPGRSLVTDPDDIGELEELEGKAAKTSADEKRLKDIYMKAAREQVRQRAFNEGDKLTKAQVEEEAQEYLDKIWKSPAAMAESTSVHKVREDQRPHDSELMTEVIEAVEDVFAEKGISLPPKKKAQLIELLYQEQSEDRGDSEKLKRKILKFTRLAS